MNINPERMAIAGALMTLKKISDVELAALNLAIELETNPKEVDGYKKAKSLFTENGGTKVHELVREAFHIEIERRNQ